MVLTKNVLRLLFLVVGILPAGAAFSDTPANRLKAADPAESPTVRTLSVLGGNVKAHWTINTDAKRFYVALEAKTLGYVALGLGEAAAMRGADIAVAHVDADGKAHVADYHAVGNQKPIKDGTLQHPPGNLPLFFLERGN